MKDLIRLVAHTPPGRIRDTSVLERLLEEYWTQLDGSATSGMCGWRLVERMENVFWRPPVLSFSIERHRVCGAAQALVQHWKVDFHRNTASITQTENRTLTPVSPSDSVEALGQSMAQAILTGTDDHRLQREADGTVCMLATWVIPSESNFSRTIGTRRRRLCKHIADTLAPYGWEKVGGFRFARLQETAR
jgi:hypothetical protein